MLICCWVGYGYNWLSLGWFLLGLIFLIFRVFILVDSGSLRVSIWFDGIKSRCWYLLFRRFFFWLLRLVI